MTEIDPDTVLVVTPEWLTDDAAVKVFGLTRTRLYELRTAGLILWKRLPLRDDTAVKSKRLSKRRATRGRVLNNCQSLRDYINKLPGGGPA